MIRWLHNVSAAIWGELDVIKYREALEAWLKAKTINEALQRALEDQKRRADLAVKMYNDAVKGQKAASDALGQRLIDEMKAKS